MRSRTSLALML